MYQRLRDLREDHDKTQKDIASMLNISQTTYSRYESGALDIPSATIIRLARFYHVSTDYLFGLTDDDRPYPLRTVWWLTAASAAMPPWQALSKRNHPK